MLGLPVAFAFLTINLLGALLWLGGTPGLLQLARNSVVSVNQLLPDPDPVLRADGRDPVPYGRRVPRHRTASRRLVLRVPGRLAVVALVAGTVFSAISGSTIATTALLGTLLLPEMLKRNYDPGMAMGPSWRSAASTC